MAAAFLTLATVTASFLSVNGGDPDITTNYAVPKVVMPDSSFFTFRVLNQSS